MFEEVTCCSPLEHMVPQGQGPQARRTGAGQGVGDLQLATPEAEGACGPSILLTASEGLAKPTQRTRTELPDDVAKKVATGTPWEPTNPLTEGL